MSLNERLQQAREASQPPTFRTGADAAPEPAAPPTPPRGGASSLLNRVEKPATGAGAPVSAVAAMRVIVHQQIVSEFADTTGLPEAAIRQRLIEIVDDQSRLRGIVITRADRQKLVDVIAADIVGLGPLDDLLADPRITEIMVNSEAQVFVETNGQMTRSPVQFDSRAQLMQIIDRIVASIGRRIDESSPMVDARLKDGSRVHIIIPPLSLRGPTVTIRKFGKEQMSAADMVANGTCTAAMMTFIEAAVKARLNIVVSGGGGSGKTTSLNVISSFLPDDERIVTIEDSAELQLRQAHVVPLETRPPNVEGKGRVSIRELVINSLRMRPDRIVIGECRGGEALDMLQAMNTGHDGSLTTLHANSAREVPSRLETLVLMAGADLPSRAIREQVASAIQLVIHQQRLRDGTRKITGLAEITGMDGENVVVEEIFRYIQLGVDDAGTVVGYHTATGVRPAALELLNVSGLAVDETMFEPTDQPQGLAATI